MVNQNDKYDYIVATRGNDYALLYTYNGREIQVKMGVIDGAKVMASWFNPKTGTLEVIGKFKNKKVLSFNPPGEVMDGNDWVLVLESF